MIKLVTPTIAMVDVYMLIARNYTRACHTTNRSNAITTTGAERIAWSTTCRTTSFNKGTYPQRTAPMRHYIYD